MSPKCESGLDLQQIPLSLLLWSLLVSDFFSSRTLGNISLCFLQCCKFGLKFKEIKKKKKRKGKINFQIQKHNVYFALLWQHHYLGEKDKLLARSQDYTSSPAFQIHLNCTAVPLHTLDHSFVKQGLSSFATSWHCSKVHSFCFIKFLEIMYKRSVKKIIMIVFGEYFSAEGLHLVCRLSFSH